MSHHAASYQPTSSSSSSSMQHHLQRKEAIRTGVIHRPEVRFGSEERFSWQKPKYVCDVAYDTPASSAAKSIIFGTSSRSGDDMLDADTKKRSNGPGSYDYARCYEHNSEYINKKGFRFAGAARQSLAMKTPSPGAVYDIHHQYYRGYDKHAGISFGRDVRKPLATPATSADADMLMPRLPCSSACITMAKKIKPLKRNDEVPGAIYDVQKYVNFKTGPAFSFSRGRGSRFTSQPYLPELD